MPGSADEPPRVSSGGGRTCFISDLGVDELAEFVDRFETTTKPDAAG
jgi:hypothetical protein